MIPVVLLKNILLQNIKLRRFYPSEPNPNSNGNPNSNPNKVVCC